VPEFNGLVSDWVNSNVGPFAFYPDVIKCPLSLHLSDAFLLLPLPLNLMSKIKSAFFCNNCGYESTKWIGKCPACHEWNTFSEEIIDKGNTKTTNWKEISGEKKINRTIALNDVAVNDTPRIQVPDPELNRVLGGGLVPGSIILVAGEPGIGKSTLFLQDGLLMKNLRVLYISGEESEQQIKMRADRLSADNPDFFLLTETDTAVIFREIKKLQPQLVIVDSIQTLQSPLIDSSAGSISQIRECAGEFQRYAKETQTPVFLIGHITKDGNIAGPKILEHMVDTVLQFEGDRHYAYRMLRTLKNRFGSTSELGIYEMTGAGMRIVTNPSEILIAQRDTVLSGSAIAATMEGMRPLLIEVQALVTPGVYGTPQRTASGFDLRRLQLLLAVLEKRGGFQLGMKDVFVNIAGGIRVEDPSIDLAVICALMSSYEDLPVPPQLCLAGEVGLNGEIRAVNRIEQRIAEAEKLGFREIIVSAFNKKGLSANSAIKVTALSSVEEVYRHLFQ